VTRSGASATGEAIDVIVPVRRPRAVCRLLEALALGSQVPTRVTLVGHEVPLDLNPHGLAVRVLRPGGDAYAVGDRDVVLRRNLGAFASDLDLLLFLDDDVVPARTTVETAGRLLHQSPVVWGHYRFRALDGLSVGALVDLSPAAGRAREEGVNRWHQWMSCYGGVAAFTREVIVEAGGYDMAYAGRHAGEDQDLGRRLSLQLGHSGQAFIHEPPFAWHDVKPEPWAPASWSNLCRGPHDLTEERLSGVLFSACRRCPWREAVGELPNDRRQPLIPFDPEMVEVAVFAL
jgi:hypothetical protein